MKLNYLLILLLYLTTPTIFATDGNDIKAEKRPFGYSRKELLSVPRIAVSGFKNPELINEHDAWSTFFRTYVRFYEDDIEQTWLKKPTYTN